MDFTDIGINSSDQDHDLRQWSYSDHLRLRSQIFESVYLKTDLIRANHELSCERDELRRINRELEAGFVEAAMIRDEMKRDLEVSRERDIEAKEKSTVLSKITKSVKSMDDFLSKSITCLSDENLVEKLETEECNSNSNSVLELYKEVEKKLQTFMVSTEKEKMEVSRTVELLEEENRDMRVLLKAAMSEKQTAEKQLKETSEQKRSALMQIAERGLQRIVFGFGFRESLEESSETRNLSLDDEEEENGLVIAIEKTMKNLRQKISHLKISLEESKLQEERLKNITEQQALKMAENKMYIDELQNRERFLTQNVEELVKKIREAESEVSRWREACELEVEAGEREVQERDQLIAILKAEVEKMRSALKISEGKLKLKEELAKTAMVAEEAAEKSLRLAERRITELLSRIEQFYRQSEEAESVERRHGKFRYVWCWPWWRLPMAASVTASGDSSCISSRALLRYGA